MARGRTRARYSLSERRQKAFELFAQGWNDTDVGRELRVHRETAASYRKRYDGTIKAQAEANPALLTDVLANTVRALSELDLIRKDAWAHMKDRKRRQMIECPECGEEFAQTFSVEVSDQTRASYHNVLLKAHDQRTKLFGLMGVKQEVFAVLQQVDQVQRAMIEWMMHELCDTDREKLALFLEARFPEYVSGSAVPALPATASMDSEVAVAS